MRCFAAKASIAQEPAQFQVGRPRHSPPSIGVLPAASSALGSEVQTGFPCLVIATERRAQALMYPTENTDLEGPPLRCRRQSVALDDSNRGHDYYAADRPLLAQTV
jgi:hypothetical protein